MEEAIDALWSFNFKQFIFENQLLADLHLKLHLRIYYFVLVIKVTE